jgi:hypothetical protein
VSVGRRARDEGRGMRGEASTNTVRAERVALATESKHPMFGTLRLCDVVATLRANGEFHLPPDSATASRRSGQTASFTCHRLCDVVATLRANGEFHLPPDSATSSRRSGRTASFTCPPTLRRRRDAQGERRSFTCHPTLRRRRDAQGERRASPAIDVCDVVATLSTNGIASRRSQQTMTMPTSPFEKGGSRGI